MKPGIKQALGCLVWAVVTACQSPAPWNTPGQLKSVQQTVPGNAASKSLFEELADRDRALFEAIFKNCDLGALAALLTENFEFYHDKWGLIATNRAQFLASISNLCKRQTAGLDPRSSRELLENSLAIYPLNNYGAIQMGVHRFYVLAEGQAAKLTEIARFTHVWKNEDGAWRISRVLSYDHQNAK